MGLFKILFLFQKSGVNSSKFVIYGFFVILFRHKIIEYFIYRRLSKFITVYRSLSQFIELF